MKKILFMVGMLSVILTTTAFAGTIFTDISAEIGGTVVTAIEDVNGDGWVDLLGCGGILLNRGEIVDGKPTFQCVTEGLDFKGKALSHPVFVDIDGDGDQDLIAALRFGDGVLFRNDSCGDELSFVDITEQAGLGGNIGHEQTHIALSDIDMDGDLDAYLAEGYPYGNGGVLYRNDTDAAGVRFTNITAASGIVAPAACRTILFSDFDGDGDPDLYLGSFTYGTNKFYLNMGDTDGDGITNFKDVTSASGLLHYNWDNSATSGDIDNDGDMDILQAQTANANIMLVYENMGDVNGDGIVDFKNVSNTSGIARTSAHGVGLGDIDNDGDMDLADASWTNPVKIYSNDGDGTFTNITSLSGIGNFIYGVRTLFADIDNDGDLDLFMKKLYMNNTNNANYLKVMLLGEGFNRDAVGAKLRVWPAGASRTIIDNLVAYREITAGTAFFSSDDYVLELGLAEGLYDLEATFASGAVTVLEAVQTGNTVQMLEGPDVFFPKRCGVITVAVDIKPGSYPNAININNRGVIPVAILTTWEFDAANVNPGSVLFGPLGAYPEHYAVEDVDYDGDMDMVLHFRTEDAGIAPEDSEAVLSGETYDGQYIEGSDSVRVLERKGRKN